MPQSSTQGRRTFRGRGGPIDGRLPPKKNARPKVKYQPGVPEESSGGRRAAPGAKHTEEHDSAIGRSDRESETLAYTTQQLSLDDNENDATAADGEHVPEVATDKRLMEIRHLQKRIQNIQLSLQTSLGLSSHNIWKTNCLFPVRNVVREWRSILAYHFTSFVEAESIDNEDGIEYMSSDVNESIKLEYRGILHSMSQQVFGLIQMALQSGPLVGSNPGYFKRCGGEVASIACEFMNDIVQLTVVSDKEMDKNDNCNVRTENTTSKCILNDTADKSDVGPIEDSGGKRSEESLESDDDTQSSSGPEQCDGNADTLEDQTASQESKMHMVNSLRQTLLFTEKQAQRFCQWRHNAEMAVEANKPPSKSALKLQSQKSKKQRQKELKMERKEKKKIKGGRG